MTLDLLPEESRGYWKHHAPGKWFKQAKASGKINNSRANLLFDSGAEVSILDIAFARKAGCQIDTIQKQECVGIGDSVYTTEGRAKIKITLDGVFVYIFDVWEGSMVGQDAIVSLDLWCARGSVWICLMVPFVHQTKFEFMWRVVRTSIAGRLMR